MRIMTEPVKKISRYNHGICYPGAPYCDPEALQKEYDEKLEIYGAEVEAARAHGATKEELKKIKKPTTANLSVKWEVWALVRGFTDPKGRRDPINDLKIVDLPNKIAEKIYNLKRDKEMGTNFDGFPLPYDVKIVVSRKKVANPGPKDIEYDLIASPKRVEVTEAEKMQLEKKTPISQILERMYEKQREQTEGTGGGGDEQSSSGGIEYPTDDIDPNDIPF